MGAKPKRTKPKPKSIKTKASNLNSKRKRAKFGKEQKKGHSGETTRFMTRTKAVKYLQITLRDFRRLCILKGIYPRDPKRKPNGKDKTYYHTKDISYLAHEPLLAKFREFKTFMKKIRKRLAKKEHGDANLMYDERPTYTLDHLVRERYPRFTDALGDLDDALSLLHLFASLPAEKTIRVERTSACERLCREWQLYVCKSRSLRKSFVSIKGIYYEAEVQGEKIVWMVPHKFSQDLPTDVDYRVMLTFLEFYETLLGFVLFKLYHSIDLSYPPKLVQARDENAEHLDSLLPVKAIKDSAAQKSNTEASADSEAEDEAGSDNENMQVEVAKPAPTKAEKKKLAALEKKMKNIQDEPEDAEVVAADAQENDADMDENNEDFAEDDQLRAVRAHERHVHSLTHLFHGLTFFLGREVPFETLEFIIRSLGGKLKRQDVDDESDPSITHQISDRPKIANQVSTREYVQPQWVFDCLNNSFLLPTDRYRIGELLPPHLSPFVDNESEGHVPTYAADIKALKAQRSAVSQKDQLVKEMMPEIADESEEEESSDESEDEEAKYAEEVEAEASGKKTKETKEAQADSEDDEEESSEDEEVEEQKSKKQSKSKKSKDDSEPTKKNAKEDNESLPEFVAAKKFKGRKVGYFFKNGDSGMGYYLDVDRKITFTGYSGVSKRKQRQLEAQEEKERNHIMMSKKGKRLYGRMQHGIKKKQEGIEKLKRKRDAIEGGKKKKTRKFK